MLLNDAHCHFFSTPFFAALGRGLKGADDREPHRTALAKLGWDDPGSAESLADRWVGRTRSRWCEPRRAHRERARRRRRRSPTPWRATRRGSSASSWSIRRSRTRPTSAAEALDARRASRDVPVSGDAPVSRSTTIAFGGCSIVAAARPGHRGVRALRRADGWRTQKTRTASPFDIRLGNPLRMSTRWLPPIRRCRSSFRSFGAGLFREALMVADLCPNVLLDTSSSNALDQLPPGPDAGRRLPPGAVGRRAGPVALRYATRRSFPAGWVKDVFEQQSSTLREIGASDDVWDRIFGGNLTGSLRDRPRSAHHETTKITKRTKSSLAKISFVAFVIRGSVSRRRLAG